MSELETLRGGNQNRRYPGFRRIKPFSRDAGCELTIAALAKADQLK